MKRSVIRSVTVAWALTVALIGGVAHQARAEGRVAVEPADTFQGSLLFSATDLEAIRAAVGARPGGRVQLEDPGGETRSAERPLWLVERLRLSALVYSDSRNWTLWFGKTSVEPGNVPAYLTDVRVTRDHADLSVISRPGAEPIPIRLRPNQTFLVSERRIIGAMGTAP